MLRLEQVLLIYARICLSELPGARTADLVLLHSEYFWSSATALV
jgi:hypothetical protein